jgi:hypothetical protein
MKIALPFNADPPTCRGLAATVVPAAREMRGNGMGRKAMF